MQVQGVLRKLISERRQLNPRFSTISFDEISKKKIFKSIKSANIRLLIDLKKDCLLVKYPFGHVPMMTDFLVNGSRDLFLFIDDSESHYNFFVKADKNFNLPFFNRKDKTC